jgi:hypothetical protein
MIIIIDRQCVIGYSLNHRSGPEGTKPMTVTFHDTYFGATAMQLVPVRTTRQGIKITRYRWTKVDGADGCITTGYKTFATEAAAIATARRDVRFSVEG